MRMKIIPPCCIGSYNFKFINVLLIFLFWLPSDAISKSDHVISGQIAVGHQYHFHLETHACLCVPEEEGYTVYSSTQWTANVQTAVAGVLGIPNNTLVDCPWWSLLPLHFPLLVLSMFLSPSFLSLSLSVDVIVRRCGGGFGAKISRPNLTAAACALGAYATRRYV